MWDLLTDKDTYRLATVPFVADYYGYAPRFIRVPSALDKNVYEDYAAKLGRTAEPAMKFRWFRATFF